MEKVKSIKAKVNETYISGSAAADCGRQGKTNGKSLLLLKKIFYEAVY